MRDLLFFTVLALCAGVAQADNGMLYIGAGLTNDSLRPQCVGVLPVGPVLADRS